MSPPLGFHSISYHHHPVSYHPLRFPSGFLSSPPVSIRFPFIPSGFHSVSFHPLRFPFGFLSSPPVSIRFPAIPPAIPIRHPVFFPFGLASFTPAISTFPLNYFPLKIPIFILFMITQFSYLFSLQLNYPFFISLSSAMKIIHFFACLSLQPNHSLSSPSFSTHLVGINQSAHPIYITSFSLISHYTAATLYRFASMCILLESVEESSTGVSL
ncbi:unnamed protein product [Acanthosepion pharaonis]|uniref:Uncharacterized protein n=1 Tax=Acanthosepion pharaonis TaxID=158019 RepID=A0A812DGV6_ACAPH|nr:unnamed protein product [Sepia pharaonis]